MKLEEIKDRLKHLFNSYPDQHELYVAADGSTYTHHHSALEYVERAKELANKGITTVQRAEVMAEGLANVVNAVADATKTAAAVVTDATKTAADATTGNAAVVADATKAAAATTAPAKPKKDAAATAPKVTAAGKGSK